LRGVLVPAASYFALVFGVGFVLGTLRVLLLVPALGERRAELLELPFMVLASFLAARWVLRRFNVPRRPGPRLAVGTCALGMLLAAELLLARLVSGESLADYVANRDPVSGAVYLLTLLLFALLPWLAGGVARTERGA
jgi:hypothetical protein